MAIIATNAKFLHIFKGVPTLTILIMKFKNCHSSKTTKHINMK